MSGRPDFSTPGTAGSGQSLAVQQRPQVESETISRGTTVAAGSDDVVEIYAPVGSVYNFLQIDLRVGAVSGASSGLHFFDVAAGNTDALPVSELFGRSDYTGDLEFRRMNWKDANDKAVPANEAATRSGVRNLRATENSPVTVTYSNDTDGDQTATRQITYVVEEVSY